MLTAVQQPELGAQGFLLGARLPERPRRGPGRGPPAEPAPSHLCGGSHCHISSAQEGGGHWAQSQFWVLILVWSK